MLPASIYGIISVLIVSSIAFAGLFFLSVNDKVLKNIIFVLVSFSVGALFGDAFVHLIPEAFKSGMKSSNISAFIILGIIVFFVLEKFIHWKHSHGETDGVCEIHKEKNPVRPAGYIILLSDTAHNFLDGVIIAASYMISAEVGITTTIAVVLHEIPQEIGRFGLLIHYGFSRIKALLFNFFSALSAVLGAALALSFGGNVSGFTPFIISLAAGGFIYIAGSDLVPEIHKTSDPKKSAIQFISILGGIALMFAFLLIE
ncbi:ZIP family metal transporter [Patescibacteria group bacterium]|nr:ZIP family metal transporter [Patescibacteria group bacterium]